MFDLHNGTEAIQSALAHYGKKQWDLLQSHVLQPWVTEARTASSCEMPLRRIIVAVIILCAFIIFVIFEAINIAANYG